MYQDWHTTPSNAPTTPREESISETALGCGGLLRKLHLVVMHDFRRLHVWQCARELAVALDAVTRRFPRSDRGVVAGQLRRAALSIPANIAEGCGKSSRKETIRFFQIASGSARETENHLLIAADLGYVPGNVREDLIGRLASIQRMLAGLMRRLPD